MKSVPFIGAHNIMVLSLRHLSCDGCLEDNSEDYQNCSVLY